jgi:hypothetical protein
LNVIKRGAHASPFLLSAPQGAATFEDVYGAENLVDKEDWLMASESQAVGVRMITVAPEIDGVMNAIIELTKRGVVFSIGHRLALLALGSMSDFSPAKMIVLRVLILRPRPCDMVHERSRIFSMPCPSYITGTQLSLVFWVLRPMSLHLCLAYCCAPGRHTQTLALLRLVQKLLIPLRLPLKAPSMHRLLPRHRLVGLKHLYYSLAGRGAELNFTAR